LIANCKTKYSVPNDCKLSQSSICF
jgi:hypothetical protein